jgi:hypothetical protein
VGQQHLGVCPCLFDSLAAEILGCPLDDLQNGPLFFQSIASQYRGFFLMNTKICAKSDCKNYMRSWNSAMEKGLSEKGCCREG